MTKRTILCILLALVLVVIGGGVWLLAKSPSEPSEIDTPQIVMPEGNPVVYERVTYIMGGENYELYIYDDGSIIYIEEKGLRMPSPGYPATRTWSTGNLTVEQVNNLLAYFENSGLDELEERYDFPGQPSEDGPPGSFSMSDMGFTIIVNSDNLSKKVTAYGYLSPDNGETYPDMPSPLNVIYGRLRALAMTTEEVYREDIKD